MTFGSTRRRIDKAGRADRVQGEGAIRSRVDDGPVTVDKAGESVSERPGDRHSVWANAGETEPARLLALFGADTAETALTTPVGD